MSCKFVIGVDEAGRGALAGPVAVGAFAASESELGHIVEALGMSGGPVRDSKQLTPAKRDAIFEHMLEYQNAAKCTIAVALISPAIIDRFGISAAVRRGIASSLSRLGINPQQCEVILDGLLKAPQSYTVQRTITGGDAKHWPIALASIAAKVTRDRHMVRLARKYSHYGFERNKGYGTAEHIAKLKERGKCGIHRNRYIKDFIL
jgi:ribonuclease HII